MNLYELHKEAFDKIADDGLAHVANMAKHFKSCADMDRALGLSNAVSHWVSGRNRASSASNAKARYWLSQNAKQEAAPIANAAMPSGGMLLIAVPAGKMETARKVLAMIGCEVTDI
jgi:hypothetical protein